MRTLALFLSSLLFGLGLAEGIVRAAGLGQTFLTRGALHEYDPRAGWKCKSGLDAHYVLPRSFDVRIRCNADSLRGGEIPREKPAGGTRIAVLGDSFMWGYGVEDADVFAQVLSRQLADSDAVNLAANGYGTVQELVRLEDQGLAYDPDVVVLAFFWNDLEDNFDDKRGGRPVARLTGSGSLEIENLPVRRAWKSSAKQWFRHHSRLFGFLEYAINLIGETTKPWRHSKRDKTSKDSLPGSFDPGTMEFTEWDVYAPPTPELDRAWEAVRLLLDRIDEPGRQRDGRTLVLFIPSKNTMTRSQFRDFFGDEAELDWDRPAKRLGRIAHDLGIEFVDLTPAFRAHPDPMALFLENNGHWNAAGHARAASLTAKQIRRPKGAS